MDDSKALNELAARAGLIPRSGPHADSRVSRDPGYDFEHLGNALADSILGPAEELLADAQARADILIGTAQRLLDDARALAADIRTTVNEQAKALAGINARLKSSGEAMLEAHRKFNGN